MDRFVCGFVNSIERDAVLNEFSFTHFVNVTPEMVTLSVICTSTIPPLPLPLLMMEVNSLPLLITNAFPDSSTNGTLSAEIEWNVTLENNRVPSMDLIRECVSGI